MQTPKQLELTSPQRHSADALLPGAMTLVAGLWAQRASGILILPSSMGRRHERIALRDGGLVQRSDYMHLNAALRREELSFEEGPISGISDWAGVGKMLLERAMALLTQREVPPVDQLETGLTLHTPWPRLDALPLSASTRKLLAQAAEDGQITLTIPPSAAPELTALLALGLVSLGKHKVAVNTPRPVVAPKVAPARPNIQPRRPEPSSWESDEILFLGGRALGEHEGLDLAALFADEGQTQGADEQVETQQSLLDQARKHISLGQWPAALELLVQASEIRLDHPQVLAYLAWARMKTPDLELEQRSRAAQTWIDMAVALDPQDQEVLSIQRLIKVLKVTLLATSRLSGVAPAGQRRQEKR